MAEGGYGMATVNNIAIDLHSGIHPDLDVEALAGEGADPRRQHILRQYIRRDIERKLQHFEDVHAQLVESMEKEDGGDEQSLTAALECVYQLPYRATAEILKQLGAEICNSFTLKTRSKYVVVSGSREIDLVRYLLQVIFRERAS